MSPHTITPAVGAMYCCKANAGLTRFTTGSPHTNTILITAEIEYGFVGKTTTVPFRCSPVSSSVAPLLNGGVDGWASKAAHVMGVAILNVLQPSTLVWFKKTQKPPSESATCAWMAANEAVGCKLTFRTMWRSSRRPFRRG
ncbi:hypothetical protein TNCV_1063861 [Trichonephila clavipes]|nr:hypothetical protein TNCV_1063861 [Trichonephila clavipes]